jgi:hypothetical protein
MSQLPCRGQLSFIDRTASNLVPVGSDAASRFAAAGIGPPPGLFTQPSQPSQQDMPACRQPLDLRKTAAITVAIANVNLQDDVMTTAPVDAGGTAAVGALLYRNHSTNTRPITVDTAARVPSQDMW